jgi:hypothetical protein
MTPAKDLTKEPPRSPRARIGAYYLLARSVDKGRALLNGTLGEYDFDCNIDNMLYGFKEVKGDDIKALLATGASDEEVAAWLDTHGAPKTPEELQTWRESIEAYSPNNDPKKKHWFPEACAKYGLDPEQTSMFQFLEADDHAAFAK